MTFLYGNHDMLYLIAFNLQLYWLLFVQVGHNTIFYCYNSMVANGTTVEAGNFGFKRTNDIILPHKTRSHSSTRASISYIILQY